MSPILVNSILITGGTGTFGRAFTKRVLDYNLAQWITIFSRDEWKQGRMREEFNDDRLRFDLGDVRDRPRLERAFQNEDVVIHAAALKQVDRSGEAFDEFLKTNVVGALNVIDACHRAGVKQCVALSSDKAVEPTTPYGISKAAAEASFVGGNAWGPCRFSLVRYGNVVGSRGSVLEIWKEQHAAGKFLTVTNAHMTRFWMGIEDAVDLVLLALMRMRGGEIFVPKSIRRGRVVDLAKKNFPSAKIEFTGKRSYEKINECLIAKEEVDRVHDCGDVYVVTPLHVRWEPEPYGLDYPLVPEDFECRSDQKE